MADAMSDSHALYRFYAVDGRLLYVGITNDPSRRWQKHREDKPWWLEVANITLEPYDSRAAVLKAERAAIITEKPQHNIVHNQIAASGQIVSTPQLDRLAPFQQGDWVALGLRDGRCPVGAIIALDDRWVSVRLKNFMHGHLTNQVVAVRWDEVDRAEMAYPEDAEHEEPFGLRMDDDHLGEFQSAWQRHHFGDGKDPVAVARAEVRREHLEMERG